MSRPWASLLDFLAGALSLLAICWLAYRALQKSEDPAKLAFRWLLTAVLLGLLAWFGRKFLSGSGGGSLAGDAGTAMVLVGTLAAFGLAFAIIWVPVLVDKITRGIGSLYTGGHEEPDRQPFYAIAETKRKHGDFPGAIAEIQTQLREFPADFRGHLLLAEIYAENLLDLEGAERALERWLHQEQLPPNHVAYALHRLADWQLKLAQDPDAARRTLERIVAQMPGTEQAHVALQRLAHLPTREHLLAAHDRPPVPLRPGVENLGLREDQSDLQPATEDPAATAARLVAHLQEHPYDNEARERLAGIYAGHYHRLDLAADQLEQLIAQPAAAAHDVVRWLHRLADYQIQLAADLDAARRSLQRIVDRFPNSAAAEQAARRMAYLQTELRAKASGRVVKFRPAEGAAEQ